jgi:glutamate carboxypeptidase
VSRDASDLGDIAHVHLPGARPERVVLLAHVDTVYPLGAWQETWRLEGDRSYGPGIYDMKAGIVQALWALRALSAVGREPGHAVDLLITPDEEVGSAASRKHIESLARGAAAVLVLEPPHMNGDLKIARKAVGEYSIRVSGRAAHQGTEPEKGMNAIVSAAYIIQEIMRLQDLEAGTTLGPNVVHGGTATNVVPDRAEVEVDVRAWDLAEAGRVDAALRAIEPLDGTDVEVSGGLNRPPMEPSNGSMELLAKAQGIAAELGFSMGGARVGGGSDGNLTAQIAPTLDGFGALGAGAHQKDLEYIHVPSLPGRTALLAGMLL